MQAQYAISAHWQGGFDELALQGWARSVRANLPAPSAELGLVFMGPDYGERATEILEILRVHAQIPLLIGSSGAGVIAGNQEIEDDPGIALGLYHLPGARLEGFYISPEDIELVKTPEAWREWTGQKQNEPGGWLLFADPFQMDCEAFIRNWNIAFPGVPTTGGLASAGSNQFATKLFLDGQVFEEGVVAVSIGGGFELATVLSQGCTPIGETWTITKARGNLIQGIGNQPAFDVIESTLQSLTSREKEKLRGNLFLGLAMDEYREDYEMGDFLIRNLLGADPATGSIAVGAQPRTGQTVQFQRRDAETASQELEELIKKRIVELGKRQVHGGCLCTCTGRGYRLFGFPNHDAALITKLFGSIGLAGFFCNGEIGPVRGKAFLHGYTASLALFVKRTDGN